ncbi:MAG: hypothetical protein M3R25_06660 [Bacteroidota bacterium]|nr:hypothetical protein [Bacteroidota bacterium]
MYQLKDTGYIILAWSGLFLIHSCSLDEGPQGTTAPALQLNVNQELSITNLSWNPVKVTDFKEYVLLQSSGDIPNSPTPQINANVSVIKRIDNDDITSHASTDILLSPQTCYKLYAAVGDRFLYSPTVCVTKNITLITGFYDRISHEKGHQEIAMFDRNINAVSTYTLENPGVSASIQESFFSSPNVHLSTYNGVRQVFISGSSQSTIKRYNLPGLTNVFSKSVSTGIESLISSGPFVYVCFTNLSNSFQILNRDNLTLVDSRLGFSFQFGRVLGVFPGDPTVVLEVSSSGTNRYEIDSDGKIINELLIPGLTIQADLQGSTAQGENIFICGLRGTIINKSAEVLNELNPSFGTNIINVKLSSDEKTAVALLSNSVTSTLEYYDLSDLNHITLRKKIELSQASFADLVIENDKVYLFGVTFDSGSSQTFILNFPLF